MNKPSLNKSELITRIVHITKQQKKSTEETVDAFIKVITESLVEGEEVRFIGFGSFTVVNRKATTGHNPRTREEIKIPASKQAKFRPGKKLKEALNPPSSGTKVVKFPKKLKK